MIKITQLAAEYIDLDESNFESSFKEAMADPATQEEMKKNDEMVRLLVEPDTAALSKEKAREILMEKIQMEFDAEARLLNLQVNSQQEAQSVQMVERTKIMDTLYMKHNVRLADLLFANKKYDTENDEEVKKMKAAQLAKRQQMQKSKQ